MAQPRDALAPVSVQVLGSFQVQQNGTTVTHFRGDKVRALLAYLAVEADQPHTRSKLAGLLWPEQPEEQALASLRQALARLRQALADGEDPLLVTRQTVQWRDGAAIVDLADFLRLAESIDLSDLEKAASLYRGQFLTGFGLPDCEAFEDWLLVTRERLGQLALEVLERLGEASLAAGQPADAVAAARRQLELEPWREPAYRQLMRALAQSGDRAGALAAYARCQQVLSDELDVTPDEETRELAQQIEAGALRAPGKRPVPAPRPERTHNLPAPLASLVGREEELARLVTLLQGETRLVTLVGAGGSGKSRVALAAAWALCPAFPDGVWWVELAGIGGGDDPALEQATVASTVATALEIPLAGRRPPLDELAAILGERTTLLILDNCEHLSEVPTIARSLLEAAPHLRLLATSRAPLGLSCETLLPLEGLPVPEEGDPEAGDPNAAAAPAVQLFLDRAGRHTPGWCGDPAAVAAAGRLCRVLEGMPLGIELAAHWVGHYTPDEIAETLQRDLAFLTAMTHDVPARQRSLQAVFAYSWSLLSETEQQALARLSVFRGGIDRAAAQAVAGVAPTTLATLVDKSLLRRLEVGRYGLHELLRQFAAERLGADLQASGEEAAIRAAHAHYMAALVEEIEPRLSGPEQVAWIARMAREQDNVRAALRWLVDAGELEPVSRVLVRLLRFWRMRGQMAEGRRWAEEVLALGADLPPVVRARACLMAGGAAILQGDEAAEALLSEAQVLARAGGDRFVEGHSLVIAGFLAPMRGDIAAGIALLRQGQEVLRQTGDEWVVAVALGGLSSLSLLAGEPDQAERYGEEGLALARRTGDPTSVATSLEYLALVALARQDFDRVVVFLEEAIAVALKCGNPEVIANGLMGLAVATVPADPVRAARSFGAAEALRETAGLAIWPGRQLLYDPALATVRAALGAETLAAAWAEGRAMTREQAVAYALAGEPASV
ncbi:MAG TPA: BTAD domain-containing putative transcriptional regulator [Chloroflexota bacterium]|nr:BTAD domain-containing putative transcriptional regulator [Chloroflexota bacterium]